MTALYSTFWRRVGAKVIDGIFTLAIGVATYLCLKRGVSFAVYQTLTLLGATINALYVILMHGRYGQTLGKMAAGVLVVTETHKRIGYREATLRYLPVLVIAAVIHIFVSLSLFPEDAITYDQIGRLVSPIRAVDWIWILAQLATVAWSDKRRAIHDYVANTVVVVEDEYERTINSSAATAGTGAV